jgi:hypothetical protein
MFIFKYFIIIIIILNLTSITNTKKLKPNVILSVISNNHIDNYGTLKSNLFSSFTIDNRLRYCNYQNITCILAGSNKNIDNIDIKIKNIFQIDDKLSNKIIKNNELNQLLKVNSGRFMKISWIYILLRCGIKEIAYIDSDAFIIDSFWSIFGDINSFNGDVFGRRKNNDYYYRKHIKNYYLALSLDSNKNNTYQTGVMFIKRSKFTRLLFIKLLVRHYNNNNNNNNINKEKLSDQIEFNNILNEDNNRISNKNHSYFKIDIYNISKVIYNSFPVCLEPWSILGLEQGDEIGSNNNESNNINNNINSSNNNDSNNNINNSKIVHFAGIYGGSSVDTGREDILNILLVSREIVKRHVIFIKSINIIENNKNNIIKSNYYIPSNDAIILLSDLLIMLNQCIEVVFSSYDIQIAEEKTIKCLNNVSIIGNSLLLSNSNTSFINYHMNNNLQILSINNTIVGEILYNDGYFIS